ncbi:MAG: VWA domain-containing protein [Oscillospiraceae bacterium]|nr:VWA domain-containing protein [Oscillospiraceae bacterium]
MKNFLNKMTSMALVLSMFISLTVPAVGEAYPTAGNVVSVGAEDDTGDLRILPAAEDWEMEEDPAAAPEMPEAPEAPEEMEEPVEPEEFWYEPEIHEDPVRSLLVQASRMEAEDAYGNPTESVLWSNGVWKRLCGRDIEAKKQNAEETVVVSITGVIPEGVSVSARYLPYSDPEVHTETALLQLEVVLTDVNGMPWIPNEPLQVSVSSETVMNAIVDGKALIAYFDAACDGKGPADYATVFTEDRVDEGLLGFDPQEPWETSHFLEDGSLDTSTGAVSFETDRVPFRFILSGQQGMRNLYAEAAESTATVTVSAPLSESLSLHAAAAKETFAGIEGETLVAVDVSLTDEDGASCQPEVPVTVTLSDAAIGEAVERGAELTVWSLSPEGTAEAVEEPYFYGSTVGFRAGNVIGYAVTEKIIPKSLVASDGKSYRITVSYPKDSGIPENAELSVSELAEGTVDYDAYLKDTAEVLGKEPESFRLARAFDISLTDPKSGEKYQPGGKVSVRIELLNETVTEQGTVEVVHFADGDSEMKMASKSGPAASVLSAKVVDGAVSFETDGFSVFVVTYTVDFHYNNMDFSIIGGNTISFKELAARLHLVEVADQAALDELLGQLHPEPVEEVIPEDDEYETDMVPYETEHASAEPVIWPEEIERFVAEIASVEWTNPDVAQVAKVEEQITVGDLVDSLGLVNQFSAEMTDKQIEAEINLVLAAGDWAFISIEPFLTEEKLTITMQNGEVYEIGVTDAQGYVATMLRNPTVNIKTGSTTTAHVSNLNFALTSNGLARVTGKAVNTAGTYYYIPDKINYQGKDYYINDVGNLTPAAINGRHVVFDDDLCLRMLDAEQTSLEPVVDRILASMMVLSGLAKESDLTDADRATETANPKGLTNARVDELAQANGFVVGVKNETDGNLFELFKRARYDAENNIVTIELKYFQKMKRDVPLDFIFVYDDSGTMASVAYNHTTQKDANNANIRYAASQSVWCRIALQVILKGIMDQQANGYNIRMTPIAFASNAFWDTSANPFYATYADAKYAIGKYYTSGGTEHYKAIEAAGSLAQISIGQNRNPIVVYLSDFHSNANTARARTAANNLRAMRNGNEPVQVYTIHMFEPNFRYDRNIATDTNHMYILNDSRPVSDLLTIFDTITKDAIGYYIGKGINVQDGINPNLAAISDSITMAVEANSGKSGNNVNWTFSDDTTRLKAGEIYSQTITVQLKDDVVFSPSMESNSTCHVLNSTDDEDGNIITTEVNKINDQPEPKGELRMILGLLDENGGKTSNVITGAQFELYSGSSAAGTPIWTGTTATASTTGGTNAGEIVIPFSAAPFAPGDTYTLKQTSTDTNIAIMPVPGTWTLTVDSNYQIHSSNGNEAETPAMTVSKGEFHIWNKSKANTLTVLVPVVIKKVWDGYTPVNGDSISFTVLGNDGQGGTVELPAYRTNNRTDDTFDELDTVSTLSAADRDINNTPWTKIVYVPATSGEGAAKLTFFDTAQDRYTNGYMVREDGIAVSAPDGEWTKSIDTTGTVPGENYTYYTYEGQEGWQTVSTTSGVSTYHLRINKEKTHSELKSVTSIQIEFTYTTSGSSTPMQAKMDIGISQRDYSGGSGDMYNYQIKIPSNWGNLTITKPELFTTRLEEGRTVRKH